MARCQKSWVLPFLLRVVLVKSHLSTTPVILWGKGSCENSPRLPAVGWWSCHAAALKPCVENLGRWTTLKKSPPCWSCVSWELRSMLAKDRGPANLLPDGEVRWAWSVSCFEIGLGFGGFWVVHIKVLRNVTRKAKTCLFNCLHFAIVLETHNRSQHWFLKPHAGIPLCCYLTAILMRRSNLLLVRRPERAKGDLKWFLERLTGWGLAFYLRVLRVDTTFFDFSELCLNLAYVAGDRVTGRIGKPSWAKLGWNAATQVV